MRLGLRTFGGFVVGFALLAATAEARTFGWNHKAEQAVGHTQQQAAASGPVVLHTAHGRGNIRLALANNGTFGTFGQAIIDPFTSDPLPSCEYPRNSDLVYLWVSAFWIGAVVDRDTLVSCGSEDFYVTSEFWPEVPELGGDFTYGSIDPGSKFYSPDVEAYSEEDILIEYYDTLTDPGNVGRDDTDGRGHRPLGLRISQRTMAWSYSYADDFVLFDYNIHNTGRNRLNRLYIGIWVDGDAFHTTRNSQEGWEDDFVGFLHSHPAPEGFGFIDTVNIAYHGDNDGDPMPRENPADWDFRSPRSVVGTRVVRTPSDSLQMSFNWWITNYSDAALDFGPRKKHTPADPFRSLGSRLGTPEGDRSKYYLLSHREFDYDLFWTAVNQEAAGWQPPPSQAEQFAQGFDCRYLLSFGPFDVEPGQSLPVTLAWVGGEETHQNARDFVENWHPQHPEHYYATLDFGNLALNARWASWVYDNPGVDTDGDGYRGKHRPLSDSVTDTFWYEGDGVPDFRGAGPPPAPFIRVTPSVGKLTIRWNGFYSETARDVFTNIADFEGYRVYSALDERPSSFTLLRSFDRENFSRFVWNEDAWKRDEVPYTRSQLRELYGDSLFDPENWPRSHPFLWDAEFHCFEPQDFNQSDLTNSIGIRKVYPEALNPGADSSLWQPDDLVYDWAKPLPKYYEYEYVVDNLLPTVPYYVAVTAFDFGSPNSGLASLETVPLNNSVLELPQPTVDSVEAGNLDVNVWPNPYRLDADYAGHGYENRKRDQTADRARLIHFANLPRVCTISIYTLDGDLVREMKHSFPEGGPLSMHDTWDLITRNTQTVTSGLYYWVVESSDRTQIGKLAIIK